MLARGEWAHAELVRWRRSTRGTWRSPRPRRPRRESSAAGHHRRSTAAAPAAEGKAEAEGKAATTRRRAGGGAEEAAAGLEPGRPASELVAPPRAAPLGAARQPAGRADPRHAGGSLASQSRRALRGRAGGLAQRAQATDSGSDRDMPARFAYLLDAPDVGARRGGRLRAGHARRRARRPNLTTCRSLKTKNGEPHQKLQTSPRAAPSASRIPQIEVAAAGTRRARWRPPAARQPDYNAQNNYNSWEADQNTPEGTNRARRLRRRRHRPPPPISGRSNRRPSDTQGHTARARRLRRGARPYKETITTSSRRGNIATWRTSGGARR